MSHVEQFLLGGGHNRDAIHIGLINNMPDAALRATELQFARLLKLAAGPLDVRLKLFSLRTIARSEETRARMAGFYDDAAFLQEAGIDALIVTGMGADAADLRGLPLWQELANLMDWAETGTLSTLFSGQATEAAVLHLDGIGARPPSKKRCGLYESQRLEDDPLFFKLAPTIIMPHLRGGDLAESDLVAKGYRVLARLGVREANAVDIFTREPAGESRFVFLKGHPEFDPQTLGREYLSQMGRFLNGETRTRPALPENYFDRATEDRLDALAGGRDLNRYQAIVQGALPCQMWQPQSVRLIGNWLMLVAAAKSRRVSSKAVPLRRRA